MSFAINPLQTVQAKDPRIRINSEREFVILDGGQRSTWKPIRSTSFSNSSVQITAPPPSPGIIIDRKVWFRCPLRISVTGKALGPQGQKPGQTLLQTGFFAMRAFALSKIINTLTTTINNNSSSINLSDVIGGLLRYQVGHDLKYHEYSMTPTMQDTFQTYEDGTLTNRNPLAGYFDNSYDLARGGFPITLIQNPEGQGTGAQDPEITAIFDVELTEPLFLSPFLFGKGDCAGFVGVQTMDFNITFLSNLARAFSYATNSEATDIQVAASIVDQASYDPPAMLFNYITPKVLTPIPEHGVVFPYYVVDRYPSDFPSFAAGEARQVSSQNIQLQSIPKRMYIYARRRNADETANTTDTFFGIEGISINWNNNSGLLSSAQPQDLYHMSVRNGCNMSWNEWSGRPVTRFGTNNPQFGLCGSVLCVEFGTDIGLGPLECPGMLGTYQLQMNVNIRNANLKEAVQPTLYVVIVSEGSFTIKQNRSIAQIGIVSKQDVLDSDKDMEVPFSYINDSQYGGNFYSGLKRFGSDIISGVKKAVPVIKDVAQVAEKVAPLVAPLLMAAGDEGGVIVGG